MQGVHEAAVEPLNQAIALWVVSCGLHAPLSDVMTAGTPNLAIHQRNSACAQVAADVD